MSKGHQIKTCADCGDLKCPLAVTKGNHIVPACMSFRPKTEGKEKT